MQKKCDIINGGWHREREGKFVSNFRCLEKTTHIVLHTKDLTTKKKKKRKEKKEITNNFTRTRTT